MPDVAIMVEGRDGPNRTLPLAARYADEWNGVYLAPDRYGELNGRLDCLPDERGRQPGEVRRSLMTRVVFGRDGDELDRVLSGRDPDELRAEGAIVGTGAEVAARIERLGEAGVDR